MVGYTDNYSIPYPEPSDNVGASVFQSLSERVDDIFTAGGGSDNGNGGGPISSPPILRYAPPSYTAGSVTTGSHLICSIPIPDPGYAYTIVAFGAFEAGHFQSTASKPVITARVGSTTGTIVGRGLGPNVDDWQTTTVVPYIESGSDPSYTGSNTVHFYLTSALGNREVMVAEFMAHAYVEIRPA